MKKIVIDEDLCVGCCLCEQNCPAVFEIKAANIFATVKVGMETSTDYTGVTEVINDCPVMAISIQEKKMIRIKQIQVSRDNDRLKGGRTEIYALTEDGRIYVGRYGPICTEENPAGKGNKWTLYWTKLPELPGR